MKKKSIGWKFYLRILFLVIMLYTFYKLGMPLSFIILLGVVIFLLIFLKGTIYIKLDHFLCRRFPFLLKLHPWVKKIIILVVFILVYMAVKYIIFWVLSLFGMDVQQMITQSMNQSAK
ncbi:MAG: hypothetical protein WC979_10260 [Candidatus Pacearchaeota archaeon]